MSGLVVLILALQVQGTGACPQVADVEARLAPLLAPGIAVGLPDRGTVTGESDGTVAVSLARSDGEAIFRRRLPRATTCADQAETVAVTLAVWEAQIHPEISLRLDRLGTGEGVSRPTPSPGPAPAGSIVGRRAEPPIPARRLVLTLGAAALGAWDSDLAPGGRVDAMLGADGLGWRGRLSAVGLGKHRLDFPPGRVEWWRLYLALGVDRMMSLTERWDLALGAAGLAGMADAKGSGYTVDRSAPSLDAGVEASARVGRRFGALRIWAGPLLVGWLRRQTVEVVGVYGALALPRMEISFALGADLSWRP